MRPLATVVFCVLAVACASDSGDVSDVSGESGDGASSEDSSGDAESTTGSGLDPCEPGANPMLEIGHGDGLYQPMGDGVVELIHGIQGGYHIVLGLQARELDASERLTGRIEGRIDGELMGSSVPYLDMRCNQQEGALQVWAIQLIFDAEPAELHERVATIEAEATDIAGTRVTSTAEVTIFDPSLE